MMIDWHDVSVNFRELRQDIGQVLIATRRSTFNQPPTKRRRIGSDLDVTLNLDKFPAIDTSVDGLTDPARFLVDSIHAKMFVGAIYSLMKFGDSVLLYPTREGLTVKTCNLAKTAAGTFNFGTDFFGAIHTFEFSRQKPCCRVFLKPFLLVLKITETLKALENFIIELDPTSETMVLRVNLRNGIKKLYKIPLTDVTPASLPSVIQRDDSSNSIVLVARQLADALEITGKDGIDICLWASNDDIIFHTPFQNTSVISKFRTGATKISDYISVQVRKLVNLTFAVRDLRALAKFADKYNSSIALYFKTAKSPLFAVVDIPGLCDATFTVSTAAVQSLDTGSRLETMIPETRVDISLATQSAQFQSVASSSLSRINNTISQFQPVYIDQSHELIRSCVNTQPSCYWRRAIAIRDWELIELP